MRPQSFSIALTARIKRIPNRAQIIPSRSKRPISVSERAEFSTICCMNSPLAPNALETRTPQTAAAPQPESHPEPRSNPRTHLRVGRFQPHRCAKTVRNHRLHGDERTLLEGHPAALQRIGLNRIDRPLRHPLLHIKPGNTENKTPHERHQRLDWRIERNQTAQLPVPEKPEMQQFRAPEQPGHAETGEGADARRKTNETHFVAPDEPAQLQGNAVYRFELRNRLILWSQGAFGL